MNKTRPVTLIVGSEARSVEVAPGEMMPDLPADLVPEIAVADWIPAGNGTYRPVMRIRSRTIRLSEDMEKRLGIGIKYESMKRLIRAGFVRGGRVTPGQYIVDVQSLLEHIDACMADPDFWDNKANRERYMQALY